MPFATRRAESIATGPAAGQASRTLPTVRTATLEIAYEEHGPPEGVPVVLLHGFPDDVHAWDEVAADLARSGCRVLVPWLRGCGPTRFLEPATPRSGQQAAIGADLLGFLASLGLGRAVLVGFDWGGRAACIVSALWPERVRALVAINGYTVQDIIAAQQPGSATEELRLWYQWYFHTSRGRAGLEQNRREIARLLWRMWSPNWQFDAETFARTAASFDNPDYVDVVIHSYRHRYGMAPGDPALDAIEARLAQLPPVPVPTIVLHGEADGVNPPRESEGQTNRFVGFYRRRVVPRAGHFLSREAPEAVVEAVRELIAGTG